MNEGPHLSVSDTGHFLCFWIVLVVLVRAPTKVDHSGSPPKERLDKFPNFYSRTDRWLAEQSFKLLLECALFSNRRSSSLESALGALLTMVMAVRTFKTHELKF